GSTVRVTSVSFSINNCVLRAMRAEKSVGSAMASSSELVCNDCVPPSTAANASMQVRGTLLYGSWAVRLHPDVWQWVRNASDLGFVGLTGLISEAHNTRAARIFAISMKKFIPIPQKKDNRGAKSSMAIPAFNPLRTYSSPSANV